MNRDAHIRLTRELALAHCIVSAIETGLLPALVRADGPIEDVAAATGLDPDGVDRVLGVLQAGGWVRRTADGWAAQDWIAAGESDGITVESTFAVFDHVTALLRDGSTMMRGEVRHDSGGVTALAKMFREPARLLRDVLPLGARTVLDVGAGSAVWSLAMAGDEGRVIAVDRPEVLEAAKRLAIEQGKADRLELLGGSFWEVELPTVDRILVANVVHLLDDTTSRELVAHVKTALKPGGELVIVDVLGTQPLDASLAAYALHLRLREPHGVVHRRDDIIRWLTDEGFADVRTISISVETMNLGAVVGTLR